MEIKEELDKKKHDLDFIYQLNKNCVRVISETSYLVYCRLIQHCEHPGEK